MPCSDLQRRKVKVEYLTFIYIYDSRLITRMGSEGNGLT